MVHAGRLWLLNKKYQTELDFLWGFSFYALSAGVEDSQPRRTIGAVPSIRETSRESLSQNESPHQ